MLDVKVNSMFCATTSILTHEVSKRDERHPCTYNAQVKRRTPLTSNGVRHPESIVTGGSDHKYINHRNARPVGFGFCQ